MNRPAPAASIRDAVMAAIGIGSYAAYLDHQRQRHPEREPMSEAEFFKNRQTAKFGGGRGRCC